MNIISKFFCFITASFMSSMAYASGGVQLQGQDSEFFGPLIRFGQMVIDNMTGGLAILVFVVAIVIAWVAWTFDPKSKALSTAIRAIAGLLVVLSLGVIVGYLQQVATGG